VPVYVTEFDVDVSQIPQDKQTAKQEELFRAVLKAILKSKTCNNIAFWGDYALSKSPNLRQIVKEVLQEQLDLAEA
jgi:GH35 family endo-1,4-beta-xylanase